MSRRLRHTARPCLQTLESRDAPAVVVSNNFDTSTTGSLPTGWSQWSSSGPAFSTTTQRAFDGSKSLAVNAASNVTARSWPTIIAPANSSVSANVYVDNMANTEVFARGQNLSTASPTFYAVSINRGVTVQLIKSVNGVRTQLAAKTSATYTSYQWLKVTLTTTGNQVKATVFNPVTNQYLNSAGQWQASATNVLTATDGAIAAAGQTGINRPAQYSGMVTVDSFVAESGSTSTPSDTQAPAISITAPGTSALSGSTTATATASDNVGVSRVEFRLDGQLRATDTTTPYSWQFNTTTLTNGSHTLTVSAFDAAGNTNAASRTLTVQNSTTTPPPPSGTGPTIPRHYSHIRIAQLAYTGTPMTSFELGLLQNSVDLVVPYTSYLNTINATAPNTPQLIYTNVSNLYEGLLLDWLNYADAKSLNREAAFYHVAQPTAFSGGSSSSQPVKNLWRVARNSTDLTGAAKNGTVGDVSFGGAVGDVTYFGYPEKFRELNFAITTAAGSSWNAVWEYPTAVNAAGQPTAWATLTTVTNTSNGMRQSGQVTFDPPSGWKVSTASGTNRLYFVRLRVTSAGTAPVAATVLGRDYVGANGTQNGTIPAFDASKDANGDGYLNNAEYAQRAANKNARFNYESRLFYPAYGQMRFATNPSSDGVKNWAADMHDRLLDSQPLADGVFVDNSNARSPVDNAVLVESSSDYATQYGLMLARVGTAIAPRWILANTTGGGTYTSNVVNQVPATMEEFALRPLATTWSRFYDYAGMVASRMSAPNSPYLVLDSHPQNGSPTDPRMQLATLAYYYLLADPQRTFLMFNGGYEPASSWTRHWVQAAAYNVGQPTGTWSEFATGNDPSNVNLTYKVFSRNYSNGLVLYKPQSYRNGVTGTLADNTATTHTLSRPHRPLRADGTLGAAVTSITLRNGEGAILIPA